MTSNSDFTDKPGGLKVGDSLPSNSDELREKLDRLIIENQSDDGSIDISDQRAMRDEILELITADRKRVELEARIEAVDTLIRNWNGFIGDMPDDEKSKLGYLELTGMLWGLAMTLRSNSKLNRRK